MRSFSWGRVLAIGLKEVAHVARDPFTMTLALVLPLVVVFIFGIAIEFNLKNIPIAIVDADKSMPSRVFTETLGSSGYFITTHVADAKEGFAQLMNEEARAIAIIPPRFSQEVLAKGNAKVQMIVDGSDGSVVSAILGYLGQIRAKTIGRLVDKTPELVPIRTRFLFNPELNSKWFVVPGLTVVILAIISVLLTALTVAREWENGSMEQLLATPVRPLEIILGKLSPYAVLGITSVFIVYVLARVFFGVPFLGSHLVFLAGTTLFLTTCLAQGLLISIVTRKQTLAMQIGIISGLLPTQLLSGFIFPIESMPAFFQYFTMILPARWFMVIVRNCFLRDSTFFDLKLPFFALITIALLFITLSILKFKRDLEP